MIVWLLVKLLFLYVAAFFASLSFFVYLNGKLLPPHRTLQFPLMWRDASSKAVVELERGQRLGGNFYIGGAGEPAVVEARRLYPNVPYDISLLLKYPDRPEIPDLGNLRINLKLFRRDGGEAGSFEILRALRYESKLLRLSREILGIPGAIWRDSGSERSERIALIERLIDAENSSASSNSKSGDFKFIEKEGNTKRENPIDRVEISISPLPPLHSAQLEVLANLSPLQHFLFYWRVPAAILIVGISTAILWFLVSIYAFIEIVKIVLHMTRTNERIKVDLSEIEEMREIELAQSESDESEVESSFESVQFPPAESVSNFIGDLRQRRKNCEDENEEEISVYSSADEDQSVPDKKGD